MDTAENKQTLWFAAVSQKQKMKVVLISYKNNLVTYSAKETVKISKKRTGVANGN